MQRVAQVRVPVVVAERPREDRSKRGETVVHRPGNDRVVVRQDVEIDDQHGITDAFHGRTDLAPDGDVAETMVLSNGQFHVHACVENTVSIEVRVRVATYRGDRREIRR